MLKLKTGEKDKGRRDRLEGRAARIHHSHSDEAESKRKRNHEHRPAHHFDRQFFHHFHRRLIRNIKYV